MRLSPLFKTSAGLVRILVVGVLLADFMQAREQQTPDTINNSSKSNSKQASNGPAQSSEVSIKGLVRDIACPIQNKAATARTFNPKCALECVRAGSPIVIQTDDGTFYMPISSSMPDQDQRRRLVPFIGKYVEIHGQVFERQGTRAIAIRDIRMLKRTLAPDAD